MVKSFSSYFDQRESKPIAEMAAQEIRYGDKGDAVHEKRKVPIFFDKDDIKYLWHFPPTLWAQAIAKRYGGLLFKAHEGIENGKPISNVQDVTLTFRGKPITFRKVDTGINRLHDKLTRDVDDDMFSQIKNSKEEKKAYEDSGKGHYGFVLKNRRKSNKHKELEFGEGYLGLTKAIASKRLGAWRKGINDGWLGDPPAGSQQSAVKFGGGKSPKTWVYGGDALDKIKQYSGNAFNHDGQGNVSWKATRENGEPIYISGKLPVMRPAKLIDAESVNQYNQYKRLAKQIEQDSDNPQKFLTYKNLQNPEYQNKINNEVMELQQAYEKASKGKGKVSQQNKREISRKITELEDQLFFGDLLNQRFGNKLGKLSPVQLRYELKNLADDMITQSKVVQKKAPKYDVHDWNVHHFNAATETDESGREYEKYPNLHTRVKGFGTFNTNWQQKETAHGALLKLGVDPSELWNELMPHVVQAGQKGINSSKTGTGEAPYVLKHPHDSRPKLGDEIMFGPLARGINNFIRNKVPSGTPAYYAMIKNWWPIFQNSSIYLRGQIGLKYFLPFARAKKEGNKKAMGAAIKLAEKGAYKAGFNYASMVHQLKTRLPDEESLQKSIGDEGGSLSDILSKEDNKMSRIANMIVSKFNRKIRPDSVDNGDIGMTGHDIEVLKQIVDREVGKETQNLPIQASTSDEKEMAKNILDSALTFQVYRHIYILNKEKQKQAKVAAGQPVTAEDDWTIEAANDFANKQVDRLLANRGISTNVEIPETKKSSIKAAQNQKEEEKAIRKEMEKIKIQSSDPNLGASGGIEKHYADMVNRIEELPEDQKAATLKKLAAVMKMPDSSQEVIDQKNMAQYVLTYFNKAPNIAAKQLNTAVNTGPIGISPEMAQKFTASLQKKLSDPATIAAITPGSSTYNHKLRAFYQKAVQDKTFGWETIANVLNKIN